jgi:hypothetical protein
LNRFALKILARKDLPGATAGQFQPHLKAEATRVWQLYQSGVLREFYFRHRHSAVLVLECASLGEARQILESLPLVRLTSNSI